MLPTGKAALARWAIKIGEEVNHGEHGTEHDGTQLYVARFSQIAREFIGGSGRCHIARQVYVIPPGKLLPDGFMEQRAEYNSATDTFHYDIGYAVGYELAKEAIGGEKDWQREMFHAQTERTLWGLYNDVKVPDITITVPPALENRDELIRKINGCVDSTGLRHNISVKIDDSDTRGMNRR